MYNNNMISPLSNGDLLQRVFKQVRETTLFDSERDIVNSIFPELDIKGGV